MTRDHGRVHDDELAIDIELVRRLVDRDAPTYAGLPIEPFAATGSTNALFGLGPDLLVRLPRQPGGSAAIDTEARWTPTLAAALTVDVPRVVTVGAPGFGYPERWSIVSRLPGSTPEAPLPAGTPLVVDLVRVVRELRAAPVSPDALADPALRSYRAGPLAAVDDDIRGYLDQCRSVPGLDLDVDACTRLWSDAVRLPDGNTSQPHWVHGDLLAENLLVGDDGRLRAVLDLGAVAVGDPSVDLVVAWEILSSPDRERFRSLVVDDGTVDEAGWLRGRAWALAIAVMTFPYYWHSMPQRCADRLTMVRAVLADAAG